MPRFSKNRLSKNRVSKKHRRYKKRATRRLKGGQVMPMGELVKKNIKDLLKVLAVVQQMGRVGRGNFTNSDKRQNILNIVKVLNEKYKNVDGTERAGRLNENVQDRIDPEPEDTRESRRSKAGHAPVPTLPN